jgi:hypothetical protein
MELYGTVGIVGLLTFLIVARVAGMPRVRPKLKHNLLALSVRR